MNKFDSLLNELEAMSSVGMGPGPSKWPVQGSVASGGPVEHPVRTFDSFDEDDTVEVNLPIKLAKKLYKLLPAKRRD